MKKKVDILSTEHASALIKINTLEIQLEEVQRAQNKCKLELRNVPRMTDENLPQMINLLYKSLDIKQENLQVNEIFRKGARENAPIIIEYKEPSSSEAVLQKIKLFNKSNKSGKLNAEHLGFAGNSAPVFVSEVLTVKSRMLFNAARELRKAGTCKFVWTSKGKVIVRKDTGHPALLISCQEQLDLLQDKAPE